MTSPSRPHRAAALLSSLERSPVGPPDDSPFILGASVRKDLREGTSDIQIIGMERAAEICGLGRTQMWRHAKEGKIPHFVTGTVDRPEYKFRLHDVIEFRRIRDREKAAREMRAMRKRMRAARLELQRRGGRVLLIQHPQRLPS